MQLSALILSHKQLFSIGSKLEGKVGIKWADLLVEEGGTVKSLLVLVEHPCGLVLRKAYPAVEHNQMVGLRAMTVLPTYARAWFFGVIAMTVQLDIFNKVGVLVRLVSVKVVLLGLPWVVLEVVVNYDSFIIADD